MRGFIFIVLLITGLFLNSCSEKTRFVLLDPEETGITFCNTVAFSDSFNVITHEYIYNGGGAGIGDLNNDGLPDVVFAGNQVSPKIYLNKGNFRFEEITGNFMGLTSDRWFSGVAIADINNDGWSDVYFSIAAGHSPADRKNQLWINRGIREKGIPEFAEMAEVFGVADSGHSVQSAFLDYDNDGDPDLYVMNNLYAHNDTIRKKVPSM